MLSQALTQWSCLIVNNFSFLYEKVTKKKKKEEIKTLILNVFEYDDESVNSHVIHDKSKIKHCYFSSSLLETSHINYKTDPDTGKIK